MSTKLREIKFKPIKDKTEPQHVHAYTIHILSSISSMNINYFLAYISVKYMYMYNH